MSLTDSPLNDFAPIDLHFARLMMRLNKTKVPELENAAAMASHVVAQGHVCAPHDIIGGADVIERLAGCDVVGKPGEFKPLILDEAGRLYLQRYWGYENALLQAIRRRLEVREMDGEEVALTDSFVRGADEVQLRAVRQALSLPLNLISGGPGTGKTYVAALAMIAIAEKVVAKKQTVRFALAAPTGKAAARLKEALEKALGKIDCSDAARLLLPAEARTLHRLIGMTPDSIHCKYDAGNPLSADVIIVDESSMVDLPMMSKLFAAARDEARIILIGDKNQLSSVEAGHVFGDLATVLQAVKSPAFTQLVRNYRSEENGAIARLALEVNEGNTEQAIELMSTGQGAIASRKFSSIPSISSPLKELVKKYWGTVASAVTVAEAMQAFSGFRILCATRSGQWGVEALNRQVEDVMQSTGVSKSGGFYKGQPVLILENDYQIKLFNGDLGIVWPDAQGELQVYFPDESGLRAVSPSRLPRHETAYAMTIHKSQGSEFGSVLMIVPPGESLILTRELIYTGITRARNHLELWYDEKAFRTAVSRSIQRWSGLQDGLRN